jgi:CRISPR type I-E-associated protein CasB/Cse2
MSKITERDRRFAAYLEGLPDRHDGRAAMAALRRALGRSPGQVPEADRCILHWLPTEPLPWQLWEETAYYLVAALFAWHQIPWHQAEGEKGLTNFGASMRVLADKLQSGGPERRLVATLACSPEELPDHLRHVVSLLKSKTIGIDWPQLLADICHWDNEDRRVQSEWARAFWGENASGTTAGEQQDAEAANKR